MCAITSSQLLKLQLAAVAITSGGTLILCNELYRSGAHMTYAKLNTLRTVALWNCIATGQFAISYVMGAHD